MLLLQQKLTSRKLFGLLAVPYYVRKTFESCNRNIDIIDVKYKEFLSNIRSLLIAIVSTAAVNCKKPYVGLLIYYHSSHHRICVTEQFAIIILCDSDK